ncbi:hypothetical protein FDP41_000318 [Naegleria fowleri]|uniref:Uncharacterized protein n=1 Tax=Naegleria fowleri TaxID=5763 RepID=A0A6A5CGI9_NAEFO|nr:uncharacterized protein FDP41_000318 [Naegleria fowleri]KAF0984419.1 hypothetical protein FDP41_000318 [Naegleria fowleri]
MGSRFLLAANTCLGMSCVLGVLGALALFSLSIVDSLNVNFSSHVDNKDFCGITSLNEHRPFSVQYILSNTDSNSTHIYKVCAEVQPGAFAGHNGTFCIYPSVPYDDHGQPIASQMKAFCGFSLAVMFERFGIVLGYLVGFVFALLWLTMGRRSIENNKIKWTGRIFGGIYTIWSVLSIAAAFYLMIADASRVATSVDWCNNVYIPHYCNPGGFDGPVEECKCDFGLYIGMPILGACLILVYVFSTITCIVKWVAEYRAVREGYRDLDASVDELTKQ